MDFKKERNLVVGGGCYKVTLVLLTYYMTNLLLCVAPYRHFELRAEICCCLGQHNVTTRGTPPAATAQSIRYPQLLSDDDGITAPGWEELSPPCPHNHWL